MFREITNDVGLDFQHHVTVGGSHALPELMGSGVAIFDANGDGRLDLLFVDAGETRSKGAPDRLFLRTADGKYRDATEGAGLDRAGYGTGIAAGDVDNDGDIDVYVGNWGGDALYLNDGSGRFKNVTRAAGIRNDRWTASVGFVDFDLDGFLDIFVTTYVRFDATRQCASSDGRADYCGPETFTGDVDVLYRNRGDGTFDDVTEREGLATTARNGLGVIFEDFNGDGRPDIYVANDGHANNLWVRRKNGGFDDMALSMGVSLNGSGVAQASMGVTSGDVDADGDLDLFITNIVNESNILYVRHDAFGFGDGTVPSKIAVPSRSHTGFGAAFFDADHDGDLDLAVANGRVARGVVVAGANVGAHWNEYADRNQFFLNDGHGVFQEGDAGDFARNVEVGRALGTADLDADGDLDVILTTVAGRARIFENTGAAGHWLQVRAWDETLERDAAGALVIVHTGSTRRQRTVSSATSYFTSCVAPVHFGLGAADRVDAIEVTWPGGSTESFPATEAGKIVTVIRGKGQAR